jgi:hypothetical protein
MGNLDSQSNIGFAKNMGMAMPLYRLSLLITSRENRRAIGEANQSSMNPLRQDYGLCLDAVAPGP